MKTLGWLIFSLSLFLALGPLSQSQEKKQRKDRKERNVDQTSTLAPIYNLFPAKDSKEAEEIGKQLVARGPSVVVQLLGEVGEKFGEKTGVNATYALHALVVYAGRPKADAERQWVAEALAKQLEAKHSADLKSFIITQLQLCGSAKEIPALAKFLSDERLCEPATQALLAIRGDAALAALRAELPKAEGKRRATINQAVEILTPKTNKK